MPPKSAKDARPRIWAEGHQNPPFDLRAFALASVAFAREALAGLLQRCARSSAALGAEIGLGRWRVPANRLGRTGRYLPRVETVGAAVGGVSAVLRAAADAICPPVPDVVPTLFATGPGPAPAQAGPSAARAPADPELAAIRSLLGAAAAEVQPAATAEAAQDAADPPGWRRQWLTDSLGSLLGHGLLVVSVPFGAVQAALAHAKGEDLRKLVDAA